MNRTKMITYGAMMTALLGLMLVVNRLTGQFFETFLIYFYPLPIMVYGAKYGWKATGIVYVSMVLLAFILCTPASLLIAAGQTALGMIYGCLSYHHVSSGKILLVTAVISSVFAFLQMYVFAGFFGYDNEADIEAAEQMLYAMLEKTNRTLAAGTDVHGLLARSLGIVSALSGLIDGVLIYYLGRLLLRRLHLPAHQS